MDHRNQWRFHFGFESHQNMSVKARYHMLDMDHRSPFQFHLGLLNHHYNLVRGNRRMCRAVPHHTHQYRYTHKRLYMNETHTDLLLERLSNHKRMKFREWSHESQY